MRSLLLMLTAMLLLGACTSVIDAIGLGDTGNDPSLIDIENYDFNPSLDTLTAGGTDATATVTFIWVTGSDRHNVTWDTGPGTLPANSNTLSGVATYQAALQVGTYTYHCSIHPGQMTGTIVVLQPR